MKQACVIGWPIGHSRSPLIHNYWLRHYGIEGRYDRREVRPEALEAFFETFIETGLVGANVTIPHKERTAEIVTVADPLTERLGSVNTVYVEDGRLMGTSTDGEGFLAGVASQVAGWRADGCRAVLLGAGGAARAIAGALLDAGADRIAIVNRTRERARAVAELFGDRIAVEPWEARSRVLADADLLVNTTALGMVGKPPLDIALDALPAHATVADIVYAPLITPLLAAARGRGLAVADGLGMLLHQAVPGFERWFGVRPEVTAELRALIVADLETAGD